MKEAVIYKEVMEFVKALKYYDLNDADSYHEHIDDMINNLKEDQYVEEAIKAYGYLVKIVKEKELNVQASLSIPLIDTVGIMAKPSNIPGDLKDLTPDALDDSESPSLIISWGAAFNNYESYIRPLDWKIFENQEDIIVRYSETRNIYEIKCQGEIYCHVTITYMRRKKNQHI